MFERDLADAYMYDLYAEDLIDWRSEIESLAPFQIIEDLITTIENQS